MQNNRAIPEGFMTVGGAAKKMGVTVRTLQYYDKEGLLTPTAESEGGRRLYTDKDMVKLHQIQSLKHLGFSLDDIKNRLPALDTPAEVAGALMEQAAAIERKIIALAEAKRQIEVLRAEVLQMQSVDFKKYADIIVNLQLNNDYYWLIKHFDGETLDHIRTRFNTETGIIFIKTFTNQLNEAVRLHNEGVLPESDKGKALAKEFWGLITEFTGGDMSMLSKLMELGQFEGMDNEWKQKQVTALAFIEPALSAYFTELGEDPFKEAAK